MQQSVIEEDSVLRNNSNGRPYRLLRVLLYIKTVEKHGAFVRIIKAEQ